MRNYIPTYLCSKRNITLLVLVTAIFGELFILFFQPVESRGWVESDWGYLLWTTIVVLVAVAMIALSRTIMYHYAKHREITYIEYAIWIFLEVCLISAVYAVFPVVVMRDFAEERGLELFYLFKEATLATTFILLIPYAFAIMLAVLKDRGERIQQLMGNTQSDPQPDKYNFYDEKGDLKLSVNPEMVYYIDSADNYVQIHYVNAGKLEKLLIRNSLKNIEWRFRDKGLVRCHRSYIVNLSLVKLFRRQEGEIYLDFGDERLPAIPVSKGYGESVMALLV